MNSFSTFLKKEWTELCRTKKLYVLLGIFVLFGMVSPILARYMAEIVSASMGSSAPVLVSAPVWSDSWKQFYNNLSQMGGISVLLIFMSSICGEKQAKTAALTLTKNLSPAKFLTAKFVAAVGAVLLAFLPAVFLCWGYTYYLFGYAGEWKDILTGALSYLIFMVVLLSTVMFASTLATTSAFAAMLAFGGYLVLILSAYLPVVGSRMPGTLLSSIPSVIMNGGPILVSKMVTAFAISFVCIFTSIHILKHQEI
jgi:ABC-2 type transport system permease protein